MSAPRWAPQPGPQAVFVACTAFEAVYGGARGGGKTDAVLGDFALHAERYGATAKGLLVRRTRIALEPVIARAAEIFGPFGGRFEASRSRFVFDNGAVLWIRFLDRDEDAQRYQGHDYTRVYVEELTQFASPAPVDKLKATLRSAAGVPCGLRATCNPGGPGHAWVKAAYVDGPRDKPLPGGLQRIFIPARVADNPALIARDPLYVERLRLSGSPGLVRAWLEGDWESVEGAFFDRWSGANILSPFEIPSFWPKLRSFDWGYAAPFSVGWWAIVSDPTPATARSGPILLPRGAMVRYREWYGAGAEPGTGLRLDAEAVAHGVLERDAGDFIADAVADPSIFAANGGPSIGERMARAGVRWRRADNTRVPRAGAMSGWDQVRARIAGPPGAEGPMLYVFETCAAFIRTVPGLQHDPLHLEDLDSRSEDHVADETRYACLARPLPASRPPAAAVEDYWARLRRPAVPSWMVL